MRVGQAICPQARVIARSLSDEAIQSVAADAFLDCFASLAMTKYAVASVT